MAIAFSHSGSGTAATSNSVTANVTINAGDTVVVAVAVNDASAVTVSSVADSASNSGYAQKATKATDTHSQCFEWAALSVASSATSITVTLSASVAALAVCVTTYSGVGSNGFGTTAVNGSGTGATLSVALTTQDSNNFVVAAIVQRGIATFTAQNGSLRVTAQNGGGTVVTAGLVDNTSASPASVTDSVTSSLGSNAWSVAAVELRSTGGGAVVHHGLPALGVGL